MEEYRLCSENASIYEIWLFSCKPKLQIRTDTIAKTFDSPIEYTR